MVKKILVLTDSLGLPRNCDGDLVNYERTWIHLLKNDFTVHQVSIGGATITDLAHQMDYHHLFNPDIVIIQVGIVDCAPRAFTRTERLLLAKLPLINRVFEKIAGKYGKQIRNFRNKSYTSPEIFKSSILRIKDFFSPIPVYFLGIVPALDGYEAQVKGIKNKIELYNSILKSNASYIPLDDMQPEHILPDFHHLSESGNEYIYNKILQLINSKNVE